MFKKDPTRKQEIALNIGLTKIVTSDAKNTFLKAVLKRGSSVTKKTNTYQAVEKDGQLVAEIPSTEALTTKDSHFVLNL